MTRRAHDDPFVTLWNDPVSRRGLLQAAGISVGAVAASGVLSACTADTPGGADATGSEEALRATLATPFLNLDPAVATDDAAITLNDFIYGALYRMSRFEPFTLEPDLATELPRKVAEGKYRMKVREGVTFHDGGPFTAEDVVYTIERIKDPKNQAFRGQFLDMITKVRTVGSHEIELQVSRPTSLLAQRLILVQVVSKQAVKASPDALKLKPVGTGPYQVRSAVSGQKISMTKFSKYAGTRRLHFDRLDIDVVQDPSARVSALRSNDSEVIESVPFSSFKRLAKASGLKAEAVPGDTRTFFCFHCGRRPFDDPRVRRAVLYAIDRDAITTSAYFGMAKPAWVGQIRPSDPDYVKPDRIYRYDPEYAKKLLADAGFGGKKIPIDFRFVSRAGVVALAPIVQQSLEAVGFVPNMLQGDDNAVPSKMAGGDFHAGILEGSSAVYDPTAEFYLRYVYYGAFPKVITHWGGKSLARVEDLLDAALYAADDADRRRNLGQVQNIVQEEVPFASLHWIDELTAWDDDLRGFRPLPQKGLLLDGVRG